jgi:hypothetical protein
LRGTPFRRSFPGLSERRYDDMDKILAKVQKLKLFFMICSGILLLSGCAIMKIEDQFGKPYKIDNSSKIKPGMSRDEVIELLGQPYIIGKSEEGDVVYKYSWSESEGTAFMFGIFISGEKRVVSVSGGEATITFSAATNNVKKVEYKIVGRSNYQRLRGANSESVR